LLNNLRSKNSDLLDYITEEDPKIKGDAADKISSVLDEFSADFA
jgi:F-type H+-transporting ATPase subunit alpha